MLKSIVSWERTMETPLSEASPGVGPMARRAHVGGLREASDAQFRKWEDFRGITRFVDSHWH